MISILNVKAVSWKQWKNRSCFCIRSASLCLLTGKLRPLISRGIHEECLLAPVIVLCCCIGSRGGGLGLVIGCSHVNPTGVRRETTNLGQGKIN